MTYSPKLSFRQSQSAKQPLSENSQVFIRTCDFLE